MLCLDVVSGRSACRGFVGRRRGWTDKLRLAGSVDAEMGRHWNTLRTRLKSRRVEPPPYCPLTGLVAPNDAYEADPQHWAHRAIRLQ